MPYLYQQEGAPGKYPCEIDLKEKETLYIRSSNHDVKSVVSSGGYRDIATPMDLINPVTSHVHMDAAPCGGCAVQVI